MIMQNNVRPWLVAGVFGVLLSGCANAGAATEGKPVAAAPMKVEKSVPAAKEQQKMLQVQKNEDGLQVVLVKDGKTRNYQLTPAELANEKALEAALAKIPAEDRDDVRQFANGDMMPELPPLPAAPMAPDVPMVVSVVTAPEAPEAPMVMVQNADGDMKQHKMIVKTMHKPMTFDMLKKHLKDGKFSKEQLQELQKIIDSKF
ncbi:MAG TPA: hypothetical protein DCS87_01455 [Rheinheimera sp.]|nr:hypothetical protein [Rheinheimera sp.]